MSQRRLEKDIPGRDKGTKDPEMAKCKPVFRNGQHSSNQVVGLDLVCLLPVVDPVLPIHFVLFLFIYLTHLF